MIVPNFFIAGAPKCGTTAIATYLGDHPSVFISNPKEPFYWCSDFSGLRDYTRVRTISEYDALFSGRRTEHKVVGEGSTEYLRSAVAVPAILNYNPSAKFLVLLRNPVELVYAFHQTQVFTMSEDVSSFEDAWRMQNLRSEGRNFPAGCIDPCLLKYREVGSLGTQLQRFFEIVPESQRRVVLFDEFTSNPAATYESILEFLGLTTDGRTSFPVVHEARSQRFRAVHRFVRRPPRFLAGPAMRCRRFLNSYKTGIVPKLKGLFSHKQKREKLPVEFERELRREFAEEVELLETLLHKDLKSWR